MSSKKDQAHSSEKPVKKKKKFVRNKRIKVGKWNKSLISSDVNQIWTELHRIVSSHPLVRASKRAGFLVEEGKYNVYTDMTQELFVALLSKERFQHYLDTEMSDAEIEAEISQIELTNLLTAQLRKRHPESYRLARRVSTLIQTSKTFKRFDNIGNEEVHRRLADRVYGLASWKQEKTTRSQQEMEQRVKSVSFQNRDTRMVGCTGDAQIVISNVELEKLIVRVFKAVDSPVNVRSLRGLVMGRLPIMDIYLVPITAPSNKNEDFTYDLDPADLRENPEEATLRKEAEREASGFVENFLGSLKSSVRGKAKQYNRMLSILWHCYLSSDGGTQLEVADKLGVSDSLVSDYRKRIEANLQELSFGGVNEARQFEKVLKLHVQEIIAIEKEEEIVA
ncbi:MAG: hypothetical protein OEM82_07405 [Acidobacteriota bacterium]|nr:hypothetical protein [Acidobacteriota bacterium]MDH3528260.1 hypothetical protein [Acidobacteriota bacterium]